MNKFLIVATISVAALLFDRYTEGRFSTPQSVDNPADSGDQLLTEAYQNQRSNLQIQAQAEVIKLLPDDKTGSRHQRFIVRLASGQSVLIAHNIDLAGHVDGLKVGDRVEFYGEYEWNNKGGVIHWTHRDPAGRHVAGWIKHANQTYQ